MGLFDGFLGNALGFVGNLIGGIEQSNSADEANETNLQIARETNEFNAQQAELNRGFNADQAAINRDWQTRANQTAMDFSADQAYQQRRQAELMSSTAYQRAVIDLKNAGLNPMLAVTQGGASTPSMASASGVTSGGSQASGSQASGVLTRVDPTVRFNRISSALAAANSAADLSLRNKQAEQVAASIRNTDADTANKLLLPMDIQAGIQLKGSQSYQATTQGHVNQYTEEKLRQTIQPLVEQIRASTQQSVAAAEQLKSQNLAIKKLSEVDPTGILPSLLQIFMSK